jgi:hypothetical protein
MVRDLDFEVCSDLISFTRNHHISWSRNHIKMFGAFNYYINVYKTIIDWVFWQFMVLLYYDKLTYLERRPFWNIHKIFIWLQSR